MRDSAVIYRSFYEAMDGLDPETKASLWEAICELSFNMKEIQLTGVAKNIFRLIKPQIEANIKRYENGLKPKQKQEQSKTEAKQKQEQSKHLTNDNDNVSVNESDNVSKNKNVVTNATKVACVTDFDLPMFDDEEIQSIKTWIDFRAKTYNLKKTNQALKVLINNLVAAKENGRNIPVMIDYFINNTTMQNINATNIEVAIKQIKAANKND